MKLLDELAAELSTKTPNKENVTAKLRDMDKRRHEFLELTDSLQTLYGEDKLASLAASTGDEADKMIDRVDNETNKARLFLSQGNSKESEGNSTSQSGTFESPHWKYVRVVDANKPSRADSNPKVFGRQEEYQSWWAAFSSCVDETNLSAQFKMLQLESCLNEEAAETIKGLGYSDHAYEAAKARLNGKYGGNRRQVQAHIAELRKMRPINADNPRELERVADIVERTVVSLKEIRSLLTWKEGHCIQLCWKNLASTTDSLKKREAWSLLKSDVAGLLRKLSTRYKHQQLSMVLPVMEMHEERAQPSLISGPQKRDVIALVKCATKNTQFGNVMCSRERNIERSGRRRRSLDCVTAA